MIACMLLLVGCPSSSIPDQTSPDGAVVGSYCTTPACADSPCAPGCLYLPKAGSCPCTAPSSIAASRFTSCSGRCGLRSLAGESSTPGGFCFRLDESAPGCTYSQGGCQQYNSACYPTDNDFNDGSAVICPSGETCSDGGDTGGEDASIICDMSTPPDLTTVPDLTTTTTQGGP